MVSLRALIQRFSKKMVLYPRGLGNVWECVGPAHDWGRYCWPKWKWSDMQTSWHGRADRRTTPHSNTGPSENCTGYGLLQKGLKKSVVITIHFTLICVSYSLNTNLGNFSTSRKMKKGWCYSQLWPKFYTISWLKTWHRWGAGPGLDWGWRKRRFTFLFSWRCAAVGHLPGFPQTQGELTRNSTIWTWRQVYYTFLLPLLKH